MTQIPNDPEQVDAADIADLLLRIDGLPLEEETIVHIKCNCQDNTQRPT